MAKAPLNHPIQKSLRYRRPHDPFSERENNVEYQELPRLHFTGCTFLHLNGGNFVFLFGGFDYAKDRATSDLIAIDVDNLSWWYVKIHGGPTNDRIHHAVVGIHNRLYIFGGKEQFNDEAPCFASYSIAEYSLDEGLWRWVVCDHAYPSHIPALGFGGKVVPVYNGKKILLTPGRNSSSAVRLFC